MLFKDWYFPSLLHYEEEKVQEEPYPPGSNVESIFLSNREGLTNLLKLAHLSKVIFKMGHSLPPISKAKPPTPEKIVAPRLGTCPSTRTLSPQRNFGG